MHKQYQLMNKRDLHDHQNEQLAQKVIEIFKQNISENARAHISETEFQTLAQIVREALSLEMTEAAEMVDKLENS